MKYCVAMYKIHLALMLIVGTTVTGSEINVASLHEGAECEVKGSSSSNCYAFLDGDSTTVWTAGENPSHIQITVWFGGQCEVLRFRFMQLRKSELKAYKALKLDFGGDIVFMAELTERTSDLTWEEFAKSPSIIADSVVITIESYHQWEYGHGFVDIQFWGTILKQKLSTTRRPVNISPRPTSMVAPASGASSDAITSDCTLSFTVMAVTVVLLVIQSIFVVLLVIYIIRLKHKAKTQIAPSQPATTDLPTQLIDEEVFVHQDDSFYLNTGTQGFWRQKDVYGCYLDLKETPEWDMFGKSLTTEAKWSRFGRYEVDLDQRESMVLDCRWKTELPMKYRGGKARRKTREGNMKTELSSLGNTAVVDRVDNNCEVHHENGDMNATNNVQLKTDYSPEGQLNRSQLAASYDIDNAAIIHPKVNEGEGEKDRKSTCDEMNIVTKIEPDPIIDEMNKQEEKESDPSLEMVPPLALHVDEEGTEDTSRSSSSSPSSSGSSSSSSSSSDTSSSVGSPKSISSSSGTESTSSSSGSSTSPSSGSSTSSSSSD